MDRICSKEKVRVYGPPLSWTLHDDGKWTTKIEQLETSKDHALTETYFHFGYKSTLCIIDSNNDPFI